MMERVALSAGRCGSECVEYSKSNLTLEEAALYSGIGINKLRKITEQKNCDFVLWNGSKRLIKRRELDKYTSKSYSI